MVFYSWKANSGMMSSKCFLVAIYLLMPHQLAWQQCIASRTSLLHHRISLVNLRISVQISLKSNLS